MLNNYLRKLSVIAVIFFTIYYSVPFYSSWVSNHPKTCTQSPMNNVTTLSNTTATTSYLMGHFEYYNTNLTKSMPLAFDYIEVKDDDYVHGAGWTDINGDFIIPIDVPPSGLRVRCYVYTQNFYSWSYKVKVIPSYSNFPYSDHMEDFILIQPGETKTINYTFFHWDETSRNAFTVFSYDTGLNKGWYYIYNTTGSDILDATARYPYPGAIPHYDNDTREIHLPGYTYSYPDTILHEYAHYAMHYAFGWWWPNPSGDYTIKGKSDQITAWVEGWAFFFPLAVKNDGTYKKVDETIDFEAQHWCSSGWDDGDSVVGRVTGALWDIYDSNNDGYDNLTDGFQRIWNIINTYNVPTFQCFWGLWNITYYTHPKTPSSPYDQQDWTNTLMAIFQNSIDYRGTGDVDADGVVDLNDVLLVAAHFGNTKQYPSRGPWDDRRDVIHDDKVDMADYLAVAINYGKIYDC